MFGTLRPHRCTLDTLSEQDQRAFYCGLCHGLAARHGQASRLLVGRDAVFLAVVVDALLPHASEVEIRRCPMVPVRSREVAASQDVPVRYAAAVQALLADQWLADRAADGARTAAAGRRLLSPIAERARTDLADLGVPLADLEGFEDRQAGVERPGVTTPDEAAVPTRDALGRVFGGIADLPGADLDAHREDLRALGRALGRVIYLADALDDLRADLLRGRFNPCLVHRHGEREPVISRRRVRRAEAGLRASLATIRRLVGCLPWQRHRALVGNVLCDRLRRDALAAAGRARAWSTADGHRELQHWRSRPRLLRAAVVFLALALNVWGFTRRAAAAVGDGRAGPRELWRRVQAGDDGGSGYCDVLVDWLRALLEECCEAVGECCDTCSDSCGQCCNVCDQCGGSCDECTGCCDECDGSCDSCCDGCDDCGGCCDDCGGCCNDCG